MINFLNQCHVMFVIDENISENLDETCNNNGNESIITENFNADPSDWTLDKSTIDHFALHGFDNQKPNDFLASKRVYADGVVRYCSSDVFKRTLINGEEKRREWVIYSQKTGTIFCGPCFLFKNIDSEFGKSTGFSDWKHWGSRVESHEHSATHKKCVLDFLYRGKTLGRIDHGLQVQINEEVSYWREVIKRVISIVSTLTARGHALRGHTEKLGSVQNGNFLMCVELLAQYDPFLCEHLKRYAERGSGHVNYLSSTIYEEIIQIMGDMVLNKIVDEVKQAKYFSLIIDSTPDVSHTDQLAIVIRYVHSETGLPVERFLKFISNPGHKAEDLFTAVTKVMNDLNIDLTNCRGQSYDNAANMAGMYNGLQTKIKDRVAPSADFVPCAAHSLNLVGTNSVELCSKAVDFFSFLQDLYTFFSLSTDRWNALRTYQNATLKSLSQTRWSSRNEACHSLRENYKAIHEILSDFSEDSTLKPVTRCEANGLKKKMEKFETALMTCFWNFVLERINAVEIKLQKVESDVVEAIELYNSLIAVFEKSRSEFDQFEEEAKVLFSFENPEYEKDGTRKKKRKLQADETRENEFEPNARDHFRISIFLVCIDALLSELRKRRSNYEDYSKKFSFLTAIFRKNSKPEIEMTLSEMRKKAVFLKQCYPEDLDENMDKELFHFMSHISEKKEEFEGISILDLYQWFFDMKLQNVYPYVDVIFRLALCTPLTNCSAERSFSALKRIKNYLRALVSQDRLQHISILHIESSILKNIEFDDVITKFCEAKARKRLLEA